MRGVFTPCQRLELLFPLPVTTSSTPGSLVHPISLPVGHKLSVPTGHSLDTPNHLHHTCSQALLDTRCRDIQGRACGPGCCQTHGRTSGPDSATTPCALRFCGEHANQGIRSRQRERTQTHTHTRTQPPTHTSSAQGFIAQGPCVVQSLQFTGKKEQKLEIRLRACTLDLAASVINVEQSLRRSTLLLHQ